MKVVVNSCYGGFCLSEEAVQWMAKRGCVEAQKTIDRGATNCGGWDYPEDEVAFRSSALLVECVETLGPKANGPCSYLEIIEIPDDVDVVIEECDGCEWIKEKHRKW